MREKKNPYRSRKERLKRWHKSLVIGGILCLIVCSLAVIYVSGQRKIVQGQRKDREEQEFLAKGVTGIQEGQEIHNQMGAQKKQETQERYDGAIQETQKKFEEEGGIFADNLFQGKTVEYGGKVYRRSSNVKAILCIGVDREGKMKEKTPFTMGGQADGIYVIAQDTARNRLRFLMVPRDCMTEILLTDVSGNILGRDVQHLNLAYAYGDGRELSCERVMEALSGMFFGFTFEHYIAADVDIIQQVNDQVGGVTVTIPKGMAGGEGMEGMAEGAEGVLTFREGERITLKGKQAEVFVRYRDTKEEHSAIYRLDRQKTFLMGFQDALQEKVKENSNIVVEILEGLEEYMITDMGKEEYLKIALDVVGAEDFGEKDFYTVPGQSVVGEVYNEFYPDRASLIPVLLELFYREVS